MSWFDALFFGIVFAGFWILGNRLDTVIERLGDIIALMEEEKNATANDVEDIEINDRD